MESAGKAGAGGEVEMNRLVVFDFDGTLADTGSGITKSAQYALDQMGWPHYETDRLGFFVGPPLNDSFMRLGMNEEEALRAVALFRERYAARGKLEFEIYPGIPELLRQMKEVGMRLGMATSKPETFAREIAGHGGFLNWFDYISGNSMNDEERVSSKADRIRDVLEKSGCLDQRDHVIMVGDRKFDIAGAKEYGVRAVGVAYGYGDRKELEEAGAERIFDTVEELSDYLLHNP